MLLRVSQKMKPAQIVAKPKGDPKKFTPEQKEQLKAYNRQCKARTRAAAKESGLCLTCAANEVIPGLNPVTNKPFATCRPCNEERAERDRVRGWPERPSRKNKRLVRQLAKAGHTKESIRKATGFARSFIDEALAQ